MRTLRRLACRRFASLQPFTDNCASEMGTIEACNYEEQLGETIRAAKARYPNLQQIFISTRIYAGYASVPLNPEPYAYEYGFSAKWLIQAQVDQIRNHTIDTVAGDMDYNSGITLLGLHGVLTCGLTGPRRVPTS